MTDILPATRVTRAFGSELSYADALSNVHKFNSRLLRGRRIRLRLPFVDSQTHIIQIPTQNYLWKQPTHRMMPYRDDQVSLYPRKPWHKKRPNPPPPSTTQPQTTTTNSTNESQSDTTINKDNNVNGSIPIPMEDDPRVAVRAGDLGNKKNYNK